MSARTASSLFNYPQSLLSISVPPENFACFEENTAQVAADTICGDDKCNPRPCASVWTQRFVCWPFKYWWAEVCVLCMFVSSIYNVRHYLVRGAVKDYRLWSMNSPSSCFNLGLGVLCNISTPLTVLNDSCTVSICVSLGSFSSAITKTTTTHHTNFKYVYNKSR